MNELTKLCQSFEKKNIPRMQDLTQPVRCWSEKDILEGNIVDAYVIIFRTQGCSWALASGCTMCGYGNDSAFTPVSEKDLKQQFDHAMKKYSGEKIVKIFTSGSFLDTAEIPQTVCTYILQHLSQTAEKIAVESRPEYVSTTILADIQEHLPNTKFEVGIGLETSNDFIRTNAINKGFTFADYKKSARLLKKHRCTVKTYVLVKPPFLTEREALADAMQTVKESSSYSDTISINPVNVQRNTLVEYLWKRHQYRPPWLWSIIELLQQGKTMTSARLQCDIAGGGSIRGPHNCPTCDRQALSAISEFSLSQKKAVFNDLTCPCKEQWCDQLDTEAISFGSIVDFSRWKP